MAFLSGLASLTWQMPVMWVLAVVLIYLSLRRGFAPLLLVPLALGILLGNLPAVPAWRESGLFAFLSQAIARGILPPLVFLGVGAITDFGPLIAYPRAFIFAGCAQVGIFLGLSVALLVGFSAFEAAALAIAGSADGALAVFVSAGRAPALLPATAFAAYCYMALMPAFQRPVLRALTSAEERRIAMPKLRFVSRTERLMFMLAVSIAAMLIFPGAAPLFGMLMLGNFLRESGATERFAESLRFELLNIASVLLSTGTGVLITGERFLRFETLVVLALSFGAFVLATGGGIVGVRLFNRIYPERPVNPLIGGAAVSAPPLSARVAAREAEGEEAENRLLPHATSVNLAGLVAMLLSAGYFLTALQP